MLVPDNLAHHSHLLQTSFSSPSPSAFLNQGLKGGAVEKAGKKGGIWGNKVHCKALGNHLRCLLKTISICL